MAFSHFFRALWSYVPFPWQAMLAERVAAGAWPQLLDLPTASGKTACLDIAVYALAAQAGRPLAERTAPRRVWFVVDRRIVVDEAFARAQAIAEKLAAAGAGPLKDVADRLRALGGTERPLAVARLRGGILRDDGWARLPSQPAVITSTVDQLGSWLLFRGYGHSRLTAPIFAGLAANDSLILLDEAHCAVPFLQTLRAVQRYRGREWAETPLDTPFGFVVMSATPPPDLSGGAVFPGGEREQALDHPELHRRLRTSKPAELVEVDRTRGTSGDPLVAEATGRAAQYLRDGARRVAVMVNRVRTAESVAAALRETLGEEADVVLLTGRIRPFERDGVVEHWTPCLRAGGPAEPPRPVVVVSTQCLEVGADFSFDALVTECASLDALRQRFGRLARLGADRPAAAAVLVRRSDLDAEEPDPIYGSALSRTWRWLWENGAVQADGRRVVDFGVEALEARVREVDDLSPLLAPADDAPVLLPAHLDLFCQTAPAARPEPDVSLYLHGRPGPPEVSVVWRCDLPPGDPGAWAEIVALCPPVSGEMLQVPLWRLRAWLAQIPAADDSADIEGTGGERQDGVGGIRPCVLWRGRDRSRIARRAGEIAPGDVVVVPAAYGIAGLGHATGAEALGAERLDLWEPARAGVGRPAAGRRLPDERAPARNGAHHASAGRPAALRLNRAVLASWLGWPPLDELLARAESPAWRRDEIQDAIDAVLASRPEGEEIPEAPPSWWFDLLEAARSGRMEDHPAGGIVLFARETSAQRRAAEPDLFADDDDLTSAADREVSLEEHSLSVRRAARKLAERCLPQGLAGAVELAVYWHDAGKLDERFQVMLHQGDEVAAFAAEAPLAKSAVILASPARRRAIREASRLPESFRHEMLSLHLAERCAPLPDDEQLAEVVLHLVASHHGHARPFAPVSADPSPPAVRGTLGGVRIELGADERAALPPPHRVDSGLADRFWRLTRRYGWWGLAYLEAIVRLGDWYGSAFTLELEGKR